MFKLCLKDLNRVWHELLTLAHGRLTPLAARNSGNLISQRGRRGWTNPMCEYLEMQDTDTAFIGITTYNLLKSAGSSGSLLLVCREEGIIPSSSQKVYDTATWWAFLLVGLTRFDVQNWLDVIPAINGGTPKKRCWFGYVYRGGHVTVDDFERFEGVEDSRAFRCAFPYNGMFLRCTLQPREVWGSLEIISHDAWCSREALVGFWSTK